METAASTATIALSDGSLAIVDREMVPKLSGYSWHPSGGDKGRPYVSAYVKGSAAGGAKRKYIRLSELVVGAPPRGLVIDHIDGNTLNNTKENLRFATKQQNARNTARKRSASAQYKGITRYVGNRWVAAISVDRFTVRSAAYKTEIEAAAAYDQMAVAIFREHARLNNVAAPPGFDALSEIRAAQAKTIARARRTLDLIGE